MLSRKTHKRIRKEFRQESLMCRSGVKSDRNMMGNLQAWASVQGAPWLPTGPRKDTKYAATCTA